VYIIYGQGIKITLGLLFVVNQALNKNVNRIWRTKML